VDVDDVLVGHWSGLPFAYGVMEAADLGFLGNGRGWSAWFDTGALCVTRFRWRCPEPGLLELRAEWTVEGTPGAEYGRQTFASMERPEPAVEVTRHHYVIGPAVPMPGADPLTAITFDEPVEFSYCFARGPREIGPEEDPTYPALPYAD
jgi:hypothetical protein